jgi:hypothetical protein
MDGKVCKNARKPVEYVQSRARDNASYANTLSFPNLQATKTLMLRSCSPSARVVGFLFPPVAHLLRAQAT